MFKVLVVAALAVVVVGCGPQKAAPRAVPFDESPYVGFESDRIGTGRVTGQAFLTTRGGDVKIGAGKTIWLYPVTPYSTEGFERGVQRGERLVPADARGAKYQRKAISDASGNFEFTGLPAGDYYLESSIWWEVADRYGTDWSGGPIGAKVTVREGETTKVMLTR